MDARRPAAPSDGDWDAVCLSNLLAATPDQAYFKDLDSHFVRVSATVVRAAGLARAELRGLAVSSDSDLLGKSDFDMFTPEQAQPAFDAEQEIISTGRPAMDLIERQTWPDRPPTYVSTSKMPLRNASGEIVGTFGFSRDVTDDRLVRRELASVLALTPDAIVRLDHDLRYVYVNPAAARMLGVDADAIIGQRDVDLLWSSDVVDAWAAALRRVVEKGESVQLDHFIGDGADRRHFDTRIVAELDGDYVTGVLLLTHDVTDRINAELALAEQAVRDPLTGLANRALLLDRLAQSLLRLERAPGMIAVLFLDLNRFKLINDSLGHAAGDALLMQVADRLRGCGRRSDTVARFGGDEFVILCDPVATSDDARAIAERVAAAIAEPVYYNGRVLYVTASIGIATAADADIDPGDILRDADTAMYQAKERSHGAGMYQLFEVDAQRRVLSQLDTETELRTAIANNELVLHYQPLRDLATGILHGVEALVRWQHPVRGILQPADFIPLAEQSSLIVDLGAWVLDEACRQLATWGVEVEGRRHAITMAVNISARQLASPLLVDMVAAALKRHAISPEQICLEITETALLEEAVSSLDTLRRIHDMGIRIALDDFGTGYSSLAHLRRFPVDIIKIDRAFVSGLDGATGDSAIVGAITAMAHALGMTTVGAGIETPSQLDSLRALGCTDGQGFFLARPQDAFHMSAMLDAE